MNEESVHCLESLDPENTINYNKKIMREASKNQGSEP